MTYKIKCLIAYFRLICVFVWAYVKNDLKRILKQLLNWKTMLLFFIVMTVISCEVWVPYLIYFITGSEWWLGIGSACWLFWLGPGTPFIELCIAITLWIRGLMIRRNERRRKNELYTKY